MGLLGGFKAKLIGKSKKLKQQPVQCLNVKYFSEFDQAPSEFQSSSSNHQEPGPAREKRKPQVRPLPKLEPTTKKPAPQPQQRETADDYPVHVANHAVSDDDNDDDGNFEIHFTTVGPAAKFNTDSSSSSDDEEDVQGANPSEYSSAARNFFFGEEEEEPIPQRPRFVISGAEDEMSDGSSASA